MSVSGESLVTVSRRTRPGRGFWSWLLQRLSGLFLVFFVGVHIVALHFIRESRIDVAGVFERLHESPLMVAFYLLFVVTVVHHALNGVWGIALDFAPSTTGRRTLGYILWAVGLLALGYGFIVLRALVALA